MNAPHRPDWPDRIPDLKYFILEGREVVPATLMEWARWFETHFPERTVGKTQIGEAEVSTVFLGLDHNIFSALGRGGQPHIFETMIFGGPWDEYQWRCSTWGEAEQQHEDACDAVRRRTPDPDED